MRIAFDLDGVLADLHKMFAATALRLYPQLDLAAVASPDTGASPPADDAGAESGSEEKEEDETLPLTRRQIRAVWDELCGQQNFWETLEEIEKGAIARIAEVAEKHKWEVLFITSRPDSAGSTVQRQTQRWLAKQGFSLPSVYVVHGSRGRIADALQLDVVVDDRADNCLDVVLESKSRAILVWRGTPASVPPSTKRLGIGVVSTVTACLEVLLEAEKTATTSSDLMQRLRRLLGLQTKPAATER